MQVERRARPDAETGDSLHDTTIVQPLAPEWRCRVLIVDDDDIVLAHLAAMLRRAHFHVYTAISAEQALRILDTTQCQIVLTDWQMPGMDGLSLCRQVRLNHVAGYVYVLMLTVRESKKDMLTSLEAGADDYMIKGSSNQEILARLEVARRITHLEYSLRRSNRENRRLSVTDPLTATHNRRYLMKYLPRELAHAQRYNRPLSVLCCDIDGFKQVNDRLGHAAGDHVLKEFAQRATQCIRESSDWLARSGGDEFVIVMPETNLAGATCVAQKLRHVLTDPPLLIHERRLNVTLSIGVTALETRNEIADTTAFELLRAADKGLYASKKSGKDQATSAAAQCA